MKIAIDMSEEIIEYIKNNGCLSVIYNDEVAKAITNGTPLDKIRAEIEAQREAASNKHSEDSVLQAYYDGLNDGLKDARDILDEHKAESEVD